MGEMQDPIPIAKPIIKRPIINIMKLIEEEQNSVPITKHMDEKYNNFLRPNKSERYPLKIAVIMAPKGTIDTVNDTSEVDK